MTTVEQLRQDRRCALNSWLAGGTPDGSPRWEGDDGRILVLAEYQWWSAPVQAAEQSKFAELDAAYNDAKSQLRLPGVF